MRVVGFLLRDPQAVGGCRDRIWIPFRTLEQRGRLGLADGDFLAAAARGLRGLSMDEPARDEAGAEATDETLVCWSSWQREVTIGPFKEGAASRRVATSVVLAGALFSLARQSRTAADSGELRVVLHPAEGAARPAYVEITGLDDDELSAVRSRAADEASWAALIRVTVADQTDASLPDIAGRYAVNNRSLTFTPRVPFEPDRAYRVRFDRARLDGLDQNAIITSIVKLPG